MLPNEVIQPFHCKKLINIQNLCHGTRGVVSLLIFIACISEIRNLLLFFQGTFYFSNVCFTSLTYILTKCIVAQNWEIMSWPPLNGCMINCLSSTKLMVANFRLEKLFVFHGIKMQKIPNYDCCYFITRIVLQSFWNGVKCVEKVIGEVHFTSEQYLITQFSNREQFPSYSVRGNSYILHIYQLLVEVFVF